MMRVLMSNSKEFLTK